MTRGLLFLAAGAISVGTPRSACAQLILAHGTPAPSKSTTATPKAASSTSATGALGGLNPPTAATSVVIRPILQPRPVDTDHAPEYGAAFTNEKPNEQVTHITVGRSLFIDTRHRLARVYITNPDILDSYTASPNQVVLTAKKAGSSTLILWDESGESKSYLVSADMNVDVLRESLKQALPYENIQVKGDEGRVVLTGTVGSTALADSAVKIAGIYSKEVSNSLMINSATVKQVRLEVKIVEVDRSKINQFGFNFFNQGGNIAAATTTGQYPSSLTVTPPTPTTPKTVTIGNPLNFSLYSSKLNIGATLQDLETMQVLQILAEPNITTMSGQKADFLAGGEFPFPIVQSSSTGNPVVTILFKSYGVKVQFLPVVNVDGTIDLTVSPEVSALDFTNAVTIAGYTIPAISTRRAETEVVLKTGQTFAISGLLDQRTTDLYSKTPGVSSIPILGQLFKSKGVTHTNTELMVIVTPTIVDPVTQETPAILPPPQRIVPLMDTNKFDKDLTPAAKKP
jgi:pilus assembly protein CpaC